MSEEEKKRYSQFAKSHGKTSVAKLIRASLDVVMRNPALLEPTETRDSKEVLRSVKESFRAFDKIIESINIVQSRLDKLEHFQEYIVKKLGASDRELKQLQQKDMSGEAIFDD